MNRIVLSVSSLVLAAAAFGQGGTPPTATLKFDKPSAVPGATVTGTLTLTFAEGLHGYQNPPSDEFQIPVKIEVVEKGFTLVKASYPKGVDFSMAGETKPAKVYQGKITIPITLKAATKPGTYNVNIRVNYQECNANSCFPPGVVVVKDALKVAKKS